MSNTRTSYSRSRSPRALLTPIPEAPDCASRKGFSRKGFPRTESAESGGVTPRQDERIARERAVTMNHASAQEDPAPDMITSARGAAKTTELREGPAQRASDARPAMLRRIPAVAVLPVPRLHLEEFFGWQSTKPHQTEASPRTCCLGHSLFEAELPYDTLSDAKLEEVLDMLTSCKEDATNTSHARRWSTGSLPAHVVLRLTTFSVVLSINNLSRAQPRFARCRPKASSTATSAMGTKTMMPTRTVCCASLGKRKGAARRKSLSDARSRSLKTPR
jgi:hypothetical protein